jgi:Flp pilus assembly protein TadG
MIVACRPRAGSGRSGAAAVELAILLPLLAFLFVIGVDYARIFYMSLTVANCARNGALYGCDPTAAATASPYTSIQEAALADAGSLSPTPTVASQFGSDSSGNYVEVTVTFPFKTITNYPGVSNSINVSRTVRMRMIQAVPNF